MINETKFGEITIENKTYKHDIWIFVNGDIKKRDQGHIFSKEELWMLLEGGPEVIVFGNGQAGVAKISQDAKNLAENKEIKLIVERTPQAIETFNKITEKKAAAMHVTC